MWCISLSNNVIGITPLIAEGFFNPESQNVIKMRKKFEFFLIFILVIMGASKSLAASKDQLVKGLSRRTILDPESASKERVSFESLYADAKGPVIIKFLRRFGCLLCRDAAAGLCKLKPVLDEKYGKDNVKVFGIGLEELGYDEFKAGKYLSCGKIYIDENHELFQICGFQQIGFIEGIGKLLSSETRARYRESKEHGIDGDLRGEKKQVGGLIVVSPKGELLYYFAQENYGHEPKNEDILRVIDTYYQKKSSDL